jgi:hypothetical protein
MITRLSASGASRNMVIMNIKLFSIVVVLLTLVNSSCSLKSTPSNGIYLIPKDYTGDVIIFFNQPDGVIPEVENGLYVYKIPGDGILKVQTPGLKGIVNLSFYYIDTNNQREKLKTLRITGDTSPTGEPQNPYGNLKQNEIENGVYVMAVGGLGSFNTKKGIIQFTSFVVGTPKNSERLHDKMNKRISDLQRKFLQES